MVINTLQNWSNEYCSQNSNIKCVCSTIKCVGIEHIHFAINLNDVSSSVIFSTFDYMVSIDVLLVLINKIIFFLQKNNIER